MSSSFRDLGLPPIPTQIVGSWCKPHWLCDHAAVYSKEGTWWRVPEEFRAEALDDAVSLALCDQVAAGMSLVTDGEQRRQTFSGHFYQWGGIDQEEPGAVTNFANDVTGFLDMKKRPEPVATDEPAPPPKFEQPRVVGPITWTEPLLGADISFAKSRTKTPLKATIIGPCSLALRLVDEHYGSLRDLAMGVADAINAEAKALVALGADVIQIDEPEVHFRYSQVQDFAVEAIDRALAGISVPTTIHMCYGYSKNIAEKRATPVFGSAIDLLAATSASALSLEYEQPNHQPELLEHTGDKDVVLGVLNLDTEAKVETADHIFERASAAIEVIGPDRLQLGPDCGMWFLPRAKSIAKLVAMESAAQRLRSK